MVGPMARPLRAVLALSTLLGGCYSGSGDPALDTTGVTVDATTQDPGETGGDSSGDVITGGTTNGSMTGDLTTMTTTPPPTTDETGDETTGSIDITTGDGETTLPDPSTTTTMPDPSTTTTMPDPTGPPDDDVPDNAYCASVANVDPAWKQLEEDVLVIVNQRRAMGADCGSKGMFGPTGPLTMEPALRCAARKHSADMEARDFFDHTNPDGESPWDRMAMAGYGGFSNAGENIAAGSPDAAGTMMQWMNSDGHCGNIMNPDFEEIGVGYYPGGQYGHLWTQVFGAK
jgi:uncharacterized protein YkwD